MYKNNAIKLSSFNQAKTKQDSKKRSLAIISRIKHEKQLME